MLTLLYACDDTLNINDIDNKVIPDSNVSFAEHIYPLLQIKCAFTGCHNGTNPNTTLNLTSWTNVTADPNVVFPFQPDLSKMVWAIEQKVGVPIMPPLNSGLALTQNQIKGIRTWIKEGAKDN